MKRFLLAALAAFLVMFTSNADAPAWQEGYIMNVPSQSCEILQDTFFGVRFGASRNQLQTRFHRYFEEDIEPKNVFTIYNVRFGGYEWHAVEFLFSEDVFNTIGFIQKCKSKKKALERVNAVCSNLEKKYGQIKPLDEGQGFYYTDPKGNRVTVLAIRLKGSWCCALTYHWKEGDAVIEKKILRQF